MSEQAEIPPELVAEVEAALPCIESLVGVMTYQCWNPQTKQHDSHVVECCAYHRSAVLAILRRVVGEKQAEIDRNLAGYRGELCSAEQKLSDFYERIAALEAQVAGLRAAVQPFVNAMADLPEDLGTVFLQIVQRNGEVESDWCITADEARALAATEAEQEDNHAD